MARREREEEPTHRSLGQPIDDRHSVEIEDGGVGDDEVAVPEVPQAIQVSKPVGQVSRQAHTREITRWQPEETWRRLGGVQFRLVVHRQVVVVVVVHTVVVVTRWRCAAEKREVRCN
jgi:hypothetical protein